MEVFGHSSIVGLGPSLCSLGVIHREHSFHRYPNNTSIVACLFVATGTCLPNRCLAMNVYSEFTIPAFRRHVTIFSAYLVNKLRFR
jgi:hypothetical protein